MILKRGRFKNTNSNKITLAIFLLTVLGIGLAFLITTIPKCIHSKLIALLILASISLAIFTLFLSFHFFYRIPIRRLVESVNKIKYGQYKPLPPYGFKDVMEMSRAINTLCESFISETEKRNLLNNEVNSIAGIYSGLYRYDSRTNSISCLRQIKNIQQMKCDSMENRELNHFINTILRICHDDDRHRLSLFLNSLVINGDLNNYLDDIDIRILTEKGIQWMRLLRILLKLKDNQHELFFAFMDISQSARAEASALENSIVFETKYKQLLGYVVFNLTRMEIFNPERGGKFQKVFMEYNSALFGKSESHFENEVMPEYRKNLKRFLNIDNIRKMINESENNPQFTYQLLNGDWRSIFVFHSSNYRPDNQEIVLYVEDANDLMLENKKYKALVDKAEAVNVAKTRFLQHMSHDIRTPMNAIMGMIEIARSYGNDTERIFDCLNKIEHSSNYLMDIINNALDMSRVESGTINLKHEPVDVAGLLEVFRTVTNSMVAAKYQKIFINAKPIKNMVILGDRTRLLQILINIVSNSTKYSEICARIDVDFTLQPQLPNGKIPITTVISDNGIGVSPKFLNKIFTPFERERDTTTYNVPGTGLGLSIVKNLVELMGGNITCESTKNVGTTMTIVIPFQVISNENNNIDCDYDYSKDDNTANDIQIKIQSIKNSTETLSNNTDIAKNSNYSKRDNLNQTDRAKSKISDLSGKRVMIVEDNEINMEITSIFVKRTGAAVTEAWNGKEAVSLFKQHDENYFDIILMDIQMPVMDGYEATRIIRLLQRDDAKKVNIIAMSANVFPEDIQDSIKAGMNAHVGKPINLNKLYEALNSASEFSDSTCE